MKKHIIYAGILAFLLIPAFLGAQQQTRQKYALVIGNASYTDLVVLKNSLNDANDMAAALSNLGFTVEKVLNGNLGQMQSAVSRLNSRLVAAKNSYGFIYYAGHGVQANGENFLIPIGASIPNESQLKDKALSVQSILSELNKANNELNVVILDCCRDNPFTWRGSVRGLSGVSGAADSIIVFAASEGMPASDGEGRNGLFTDHLLKNLKTPSIEVSELIRRTGSDVSKASDNLQRPAVYNQFFGIAYLGNVPAARVTRERPGARRQQPGAAQTAVTRPAAQNTQKAADPAQVKALIDRGNTYSQSGDYANAIEMFSQAIDIDPVNITALTNRGIAFNNSYDFDSAIVDLTEAIRLDSKSALAYNSRGYAYNSNKLYNQAIADFDEAIKLQPNYTVAYTNRGEACFNQKNYDRAIADFSEAIKQGNNKVIDYNNRGNAYYAKGDYTRAIADYEQALKINPGNIYTKQNLNNAQKAFIGWNAAKSPW